MVGSFVVTVDRSLFSETFDLMGNLGQEVYIIDDLNQIVVSNKEHLVGTVWSEDTSL
ncbi:MAG: hypothetical protein LRY71_16595 [Bacillaceae bacterium]|nr:hypothetical protein [Bacillaceae bacterium]